MHLIPGTSLLSILLPLWTSIITLGKKNDDEKTLLLKLIWLYWGDIDISPSFHPSSLIDSKVHNVQILKGLYLVQNHGLFG